MTNDEFQEVWKNCVVINENGKVSKRLGEIFFLCVGPMNGGLLFDPGGPQGAQAVILKVDEDDNCYQKIDCRVSDEEGWRLEGKIKELEPKD